MAALSLRGDETVGGGRGEKLALALCRISLGPVAQANERFTFDYYLLRLSDDLSAFFFVWALCSGQTEV